MLKLTNLITVQAYFALKKLPEKGGLKGVSPSRSHQRAEIDKFALVVLGYAHL
jgi:hypothetical protein